jgi:UDP-GlcNAc:undecaprenyl-phosphate/decaprenyl-phosphate GlcNAc-1-phosphate transferase
MVFAADGGGTVLGYGVVFGIAALVTFVLTPVCRRMAPRWGFMAKPDAERRLHSVAKPALGGLAMCGGLLAGLLVAWRMGQFRELFVSSSEAWGVAVAAVVVVMVGMLDDRFELSPPAKLAGQVLAGSALYLLGVTMYYFRFPFLDIVVLSRDLVPLVTVLWVVGMCNAINLIDGLDGLAAGLVAIAAAAFFLFGDRLFKSNLLGGDNIGPLIAALTCGICIGFLPWNFPPAKIFMGDSGALLLGLLMAASTMVVGGRAEPDAPFSGQTYFLYAPLFIPFVILGVPMLDTLLAILRRTVNRTGFANADREHLHYRLIEFGHGPRRVVFILWSFTAILSGFVLVPPFTLGAVGWLLLGVAFFLTLVFALLPVVAERRERRLGARMADLTVSDAVAGSVPHTVNGAELSGADVSGADVSGADVSGADVSGALANGAVVNGAVLNGAVLNGADRPSSGQEPDGAVLSSLNGALFRDTRNASSRNRSD